MKTAVLTVNGVEVAETVELAGNLLARMVGLLGRKALGRGRAIYLSPCASIHTFFMKFPIDLIFVDRQMVVVKIVRNVQPFKTVLGGSGAWSVLEMESGWIPENAIKAGSRIQLDLKQISC